MGVQAKLQKVQEEANTYKEALNDTLTKEKRKAELEAIVAKNGAIALYDSEDLEERIQEPVVQGQVASITEKLDDLKGDITNDITDLNERINTLRDNLTELETLKSESSEDGEPVLRRASSVGSMNVQIQNLCEGDGAGGKLTTMNGDRQSELTELLSAEESREAARKAFADAANAVKADCESKTKQLSTLDGEPEEQLEEIGKAYKSARNICEKSIMDKAGTQLTPEQIAQIRQVFDYFDEDKDGKLSLKEFQDGCQGMGIVMDEGTSEDHYGKLGSGSELSFDQFSTFMADQMKTGTSLEDVIAAFRSLADGDTISNDTITQHFTSREDYAQYLNDNMPTCEDGNRDFIAFTNELFTR